MININWDNYISLCNKLADEVYNRGEEIDLIIGIARGGLIPATILSHRLNKPLGVIATSSYSDLKNTQGRLITSYNVAMVQIPGQRMEKVLLVDDLADTGQTFMKVLETLNVRYNKIITASLIKKIGTKYVPDICIKEYPRDEWIQFPFEAKATEPHPEIRQQVAKPRDPTVKVFGGSSNKSSGRMEQVRALLMKDPGMTKQDICAQTGIHQSYLPRVLQKLGLQAKNGKKEPIKKKPDASSIKVKSAMAKLEEMGIFNEKEEDKDG